LAVGLVTNFHYFFLFQKEGHYGHFNKKLVKLKRTKTWEINFI
jgi:nicotinamide riboside transporter PnuC